LANCKVKKWDYTAFMKTSMKRKAGKRKVRDSDEEGDEEDAVECGQPPAGELIDRVSSKLLLISS
jgi:hypothetical protein